jgi:hypothetical protein
VLLELGGNGRPVVDFYFERMKPGSVAMKISGEVLLEARRIAR